MRDLIVITPGSSQKRKVGLDPVTRLKFSGLHTGGTGLQPFLTRGLSSKLALLSLEDLQISRGPLLSLAGVLAPGQSGAKKQCKQHKAQIQIPTRSTSVSSVPPVFPARVLIQRLVVEDHPAGYTEHKGRSERGSTGPGGTAGYSLIKVMHRICILKAKGDQESLFLCKWTI